MATPDVQALISQAAADNGVPTELLTALLTQESSLNPKAQNASTGALGMAQLMPTTARALGVSDPTDPAQAIPAAAKYLKQGLDRYGGDVTQALKFYYGGPNEKLWGPKTQAYPSQVMARLMPPVDQSATADPNTMLGIPPAATGAVFTDLANRFGDYLKDTLKNTAAQFPTYTGDNAQDILQNVAKEDPNNFRKIFGLATGFSGGGLTFAGTASKEAEEGAASLLPRVLARFQGENPQMSPDELNQHMWEQTGWFQGPDKQWRYEIPDQEAALKLPNGVGLDPNANLRLVKDTTLGQLLDHPQLFSAYPELKNYTVKPLPPYYPDTAGMADIEGKTIYLGRNTPEEMILTLLHETQHIIQAKEGFAQGGSISDFLPDNFHADHMVKEKAVQDAVKAYDASVPDPATSSQQLRQALDDVHPYRQMLKDARDKYNRLAGEIEAYNVEARRTQRDTDFPLSTEGYPDVEQIVRFRDGLVAQRVDHDPFSLESVDHDPFALSPVDHDPFNVP